MTPLDEAVLSEALREQLPTVVFLDGGGWLRTRTPLRRTIADCPEPVVCIAVPDEADWQPLLEPVERPPGRFSVANPPRRSLDFVRSCWLWRIGYTSADDQRFACDLPTLDDGSIGARWDASVPEQHDMPALIRKVWRILERVATNRVKWGVPLMNVLNWGSDRRLMAEERGGPCWFGHHALEWCAAGGPRRMLDGAFRPCDDWAPPQDPWYQTLRRRVEERYGADFGLPPAAPPD